MSLERHHRSLHLHFRWFINPITKSFTHPKNFCYRFVCVQRIQSVKMAFAQQHERVRFNAHFADICKKIISQTIFLFVPVFFLTHFCNPSLDNFNQTFHFPGLNFPLARRHSHAVKKICHWWEHPYQTDETLYLEIDEIALALSDYYIFNLPWILLCNVIVISRSILTRHPFLFD